MSLALPTIFSCITLLPMAARPMSVMAISITRETISDMPRWAKRAGPEQTRRSRRMVN